jgi:micrococcal nuclease
MLRYTAPLHGRRNKGRKLRSKWSMPRGALWLVLSGAVASGYLIGELRSRYSGAGRDPDAAGAFRLCRLVFQKNCVIDGDTIRYQGVKIRLADIDAPEISSPRCASEAAAGHRAKERLLELINAGPIQLVHRGGPDTDKYGRKLRVVERNGRSLGDILVAEGLALRWNGARRSWCG